MIAKAGVARHSCRCRSALESEDWRNETFVQYAYCVTVGRLAEWGFRADDVLRYGRKIGGMRLSCRTLTALRSEDWRSATLVQMSFCVRVGRLAEWGFRAA